MKNKKIVILIAIIYMTVSVHYAFALKRAVFPDSQSLQPLPPDVHANISGNINSTTTVLPEDNLQTPIQKPTIDETSTNKENNLKDNKSLIIWPIILLIVIILYVIYKTLKRKNLFNVTHN